MRALVIREPWISKILRGEKTWEMRSVATKIRGEIALIRQGSGLVVGLARIVDCLPPLDLSNYMDHAERHAIPAKMLDEVIAYRWVHPWVLADARALQKPVPYKHKSGAVLFVTLDDDVATAIRRQADGQPVAQELVMSHRCAGPSTNPATAACSASAPVSFKTARPTPDAGPGHGIAGDANSRPLFVFRPQDAQAYGYPVADDGFVVLKGSTAMRAGSPKVKRDRSLRDDLVRSGVLVPANDPRLYIFSTDHEFSSASAAAGVIKDGNASGPNLWKNERDGATLKDFLDASRP